LVRFGFLPLVVSIAVDAVSETFRITTELSAWYSGIGRAGILLLLSLTAYAFYTSLGGQAILGTSQRAAPFDRRLFAGRNRDSIRTIAPGSP
jgi:hypothetical protein